MDEHPEILNNQMVRMIARTDFETALRRGFWHSVKSWITNSDNKLLPFDEIIKQLPLKGQHSLGMKVIPIDKIIGSVGRYRDFDRAFLPRQSHTRSRWMNIDTAHLKDVILPPIEVYKMGEVYFVKDGNHRVSVAREKGQIYIDADVIELDVIVPIDADLSIDDIIKKREQVEFYEKTQLHKILPDAKIELSVPGGYDKIIEHIEVHRWFMGEERKSDVSWNEAVISWYYEVYRPLAEIIREQKILKNFPHRTDADLYLWIIEHLYYLREKFREEVSLKEAAAHFAEEYAPGFFKRIFGFFREQKAPNPESGDADSQQAVQDEESAN